MAARVIFDPEGFKNIEENGEITGFSFRYKHQYYRGITLSIVHDLTVNIDGEDIPREDISLTVNGETFTLDQMTTVIDSDYRGELMVSLFNQSKEDRTVERGERIAQLVIVPYLRADFEETGELSDTARGAGGFGSTGTK